jgi:hypothetical protein
MTTNQNHGERVYDGVYIGGAVGELSLTTTAAQTAALNEGLYDIMATADAFVKTGATANDVTTSSTGVGRKIAAGVWLPNVRVDEGMKLGGIVASGTATLYYQKVG